MEELSIVTLIVGTRLESGFCINLYTFFNSIGVIFPDFFPNDIKNKSIFWSLLVVRFPAFSGLLRKGNGRQLEHVRGSRVVDLVSVIFHQVGVIPDRRELARARRG